MRRKTGPGWWWKLTAAVVLPIFRAAVTLRIQPASSLPPTGPFIVSPNHYSEIDPVIMGVAVWRLGRTPRFLAKASLFTIPVLGTYLKALGQIPVERSGGSSAGALDAAHQLIEQGQGVIVYPEGTLTRQPDLWPMRGKTGAVRMALETGIPLYPAAHWGTQKLMARYGKKIRLRPRPTITVIVGQPLDLSAYQQRPLTREVLEEATNTLMLAIQDLVAQLRSETPPETIFHPGPSTPGRPS